MRIREAAILKALTRRIFLRGQLSEWRFQRRWRVVNRRARAYAADGDNHQTRRIFSARRNGMTMHSRTPCAPALFCGAARILFFFASRTSRSLAHLPLYIAARSLSQTTRIAHLVVATRCRVLFGTSMGISVISRCLKSNASFAKRWRKRQHQNLGRARHSGHSRKYHRLFCVLGNFQDGGVGWWVASGQRHQPHIASYRAAANNTLLPRAQKKKMAAS